MVFAEFLYRPIAKRVLMPWDKALDAWCGIGAKAGGVAGGVLGVIVYGVAAAELSKKRGFKPGSYQDCLVKLGGASLGAVLCIPAGAYIGTLSPIWMPVVIAYFLVNRVIDAFSPAPPETTPAPAPAPEQPITYFQMTIGGSHPAPPEKLS